MRFLFVNLGHAYAHFALALLPAASPARTVPLAPAMAQTKRPRSI